MDSLPLFKARFANYFARYRPLQWLLEANPSSWWLLNKLTTTLISTRVFCCPHMNWTRQSPLYQCGLELLVQIQHMSTYRWRLAGFSAANWTQADVFPPLLTDLCFQLWTVVAWGADVPLGGFWWNKEAEYFADGTLQVTWLLLWWSRNWLDILERCCLRRESVAMWATWERRGGAKVG